jgi:hypothetical protein
MQSAIEAHVSSYPESYWEVDLWKGPLLKYFSTLFKVPNSIFDEGAMKKRAIKVGERADFLKELDILGEQIHIEREKLKDEVQTLNKQLEAIDNLPSLMQPRLTNRMLNTGICRVITPTPYQSLKS